MFSVFVFSTTENEKEKSFGSKILKGYFVGHNSEGAKQIAFFPVPKGTCEVITTVSHRLSPTQDALVPPAWIEISEANINSTRNIRLCEEIPTTEWSCSHEVNIDTEYQFVKVLISDLRYSIDLAYNCER